MDAIKYVVDTLLWLLQLAFLLRFLFQLVRADFREPIADAILRVTNWLILPLRRVLPPVGKIDTATLLSVLLIACLHTEIMFLLAGALAVDPIWFARVTLLGLVDMVLKVYLFAMLLYWVATFVAPGGMAPGLRLLAQLCEPILRRVRRVIPPIGQLDLSFLWVSIAIGALLILLR
jgi:YggT family protein